MTIAVAAVGTVVAGALGHCENFILFDVENGKISARKDVPYPHHRSGFLPEFLAENGASVIIVGYPGQAIVDAFQKQNIKNRCRCPRRCHGCCQCLPARLMKRIVTK